MTIRQLLLALPCLVLGWLGVLIAVSFLTDEAPAYVVLLPAKTFATRLDADIAILSVTDSTVTVSASAPHVAQRLYRAGARLVLPAGLSGCLPAPEVLRALDK